MSITVKTQMKAKKAEYKEVPIAELEDFVCENPHSHEIIFGPCRPYYDFDKKYEDRDEAKDNYLSDLNGALDTLTFFKKAEVLAFDASGQIESGWKNSFHFRVKGWGYYESAAYIPRFPMFDSQVYCERPECQTIDDKGIKSIRLPYCEKEGSDRPLIRIIPKYKADKIISVTRVDKMGGDLYGMLGEPFETWCPTYIVGEKLRKPTASAMRLINERIEKSKVKDKALGDELKDGWFPERSLEQIQFIVDALGERSEHDERRNIVWGLSDIAHKQNMIEDVREIAHDFVARVKGDDYDRTETDGWFDSEKQGISFGSVIYWARQDSPNIDWAQQLSFTQKKVIIPPTEATFYEDKYELLATGPTEQQVQTWMMGCLAFIQVSSTWYLRFKDGGWKELPKCPKKFPFSTASDASHIRVTEIIKGKPEEVKKSFFDILSELKDTMSFAPRRFIKAEYLPYFGQEPANTFNLWKGWASPLSDQKIPDDNPVVKRVNDHLFDMCGRDRVATEYYISHTACMIQKPTEKRPNTVAYSYKQGSGKSLWFAFLDDYVIGEHNVLQLTDMSLILGHFNSMAADNLLTVCEEAKADGKSITDSDAFKNLSTSKKVVTVRKSFDGEKNRNYSSYHFNTNHKNAFKIEASDRRFFMFESDCVHVGDFAYFKDLCDMIMNKEAGAIYLNWLAQRDLSQFNVQDIPMTKLKQDAKVRSMGHVLDHVKSLAEGTRHFTLPTALGIKTLYADFKEYCNEIGVQKKYIPMQSSYKEQIEQALELEYKRHTVETDDGTTRIQSFWLDTDVLEARFQKHLKIDTPIFTREEKDD